MNRSVKEVLKKLFDYSILTMYNTQLYLSVANELYKKKHKFMGFAMIEMVSNFT